MQSAGAEGDSDRLVLILDPELVGMEDEPWGAFGGIGRKAPVYSLELRQIDAGTKTRPGVGAQIEAAIGLEALGEDLDREYAFDAAVTQHAVAALDVLRDEIAVGAEKQP